ncbi:MAG: cupredoxin family copper-binding protein [Chloroflexi bacterium]|nr:cupredoxin family copper-binding protein [Chloroflexota bacterium]
MWGFAVCGLILVGSVLLVACAPQVATVSSVAFATPVPPAALATVPPPKPAHPTDANGGPSVTIENFNFVAASLTVPAGTTVVWTNADDIEHTVTASDNSFSSSAIEPDGQFSYTFSTPGTYTYFCAIHPFMTGKVIVQ